MSGQVLGIVPARLASSRLPRKPLYPLHGRPLIEWVWRRVETMSALDHAVVATDSDEVAEVGREEDPEEDREGRQVAGVF